ncbi:MAG: transcriptional repressor [Prevotella sp.]|nr:transcriptional repressor [Prevotella sp.]MBR6456873.1 transcriptional repressor [Prevotella sp.]MBR6493673.1 transcriptional repressor [Prevotella sp.]
MRNDPVKSTVRQILTNHLEVNKHRKTPERYAILDAVYSMKGHFTMEELDGYLSEHSFRVSRATLYNAMRLFQELRLVTKHHLTSGTMFEAAYASRNHCHQICTVCGKMTEVRVPEVVQAVNRARLKRFRKDTYSIDFYGICSTCQAKITRKKSKAEKSNNKKINRQ